jgi:hypothetical protein
MKGFARRHPECAFRDIADEGGLVVLPGRGEVKVLNPAAIKIFSLLDGEHSPEEIAGEITKEYDVQESQALADVRAFVAELAEHGMLADEAAEEETAR